MPDEPKGKLTETVVKENKASVTAKPPEPKVEPKVAENPPVPAPVPNAPQPAPSAPAAAPEPPKATENPVPPTEAAKPPEAQQPPSGTEADENPKKKRGKRGRNPAPRQQRQESERAGNPRQERYVSLSLDAIVFDGEKNIEGTLRVQRDVLDNKDRSRWRFLMGKAYHSLGVVHGGGRLGDIVDSDATVEVIDPAYDPNIEFDCDVAVWFEAENPPAPRQQPRQESEHSNPGNPTDAHVGQEMVTVAGHGSGMRSVYRDRRGREYVIIGATRYYQGIHWGAADEDSENPAPRRNPPCTHPNLQRTNYSAVNTKENKPEHRGKAIWACGDCGKTLIEK